MSKLKQALWWLWCQLLGGDDPVEDGTPALLQSEEDECH